MQVLIASRCRERLAPSLRTWGPVARQCTIARKAIVAPHHGGCWGHFGHDRLSTALPKTTAQLPAQRDIAGRISRSRNLQVFCYATSTAGEPSEPAGTLDNVAKELDALNISELGKENAEDVDDEGQSAIADTEPIGDSANTPSRVHFLRQTADGLDVPARRIKNKSGQRHGLEGPSLLGRPRTILAEYIRDILVPNASAPNSRPDDTSLRRKHEKYLQSVNYQWEDIASWASIVTSASGEAAAAKLLQLAESTADPTALHRNKAPVFLLTVLLRRRDLSARALKILLLQAWNMFGNVHDARRIDRPLKDRNLDRVRLPSYSLRQTGNYPEIGLTTVMTIHLHLLRHARRRWPEIIPRVVDGLSSLCVKFIPRPDIGAGHAQKLTFIFNRMLQVVSRPSRNEPFQNISLAHKAQMQLLDRMSQFEPALPVSRGGYRAVVSVQLRQPKTSREQDWASLQSKAWPPWKEDKYGLDADKGVEYGISRARRTLIRSAEDGYAPQEWEKAAGILAGWDTDNSPTIQTRSAPPSLEAPAAEKENGKDSTLVWAARIQATRTLDEAWACFQSYSSQVPEWTLSVWFEMYKKLVYARIGAKTSHTSNVGVAGTFARAQLAPGDSLQVWQTSENPRERPFLREPIPNEYDFVSDILQRGLRLTPHVLIFALRYAENLTAGFQYLHASTLSSQALAMLSGQDEASSETLLQHVTPMIINNLVLLLCQSANNPSYHKAAAIKLPVDDTSFVVPSPEHTLHLAYSLLLAGKIADGMTWFHLLGAAIQGTDFDRMNSRLRELRHIRERSAPNHRQGSQLLPLSDFLRVVVSKCIDINFREFLFLCQQLQKPLESARECPDDDESRVETLQVYIGQMKKLFRDVTQGERGETLSAHIVSEASSISLSQNLPPLSLEQTYGQDVKDATGGSDDAYALPRLVNTPRPVHLHGFMRLLSLSRVPEDVLDLLRWMSYHAPELNAKIQGHRNADAQMRRTLIRARIFLEDWDSITENKGSVSSASHEAEDSPEASEEFNSATEPSSGRGPLLTEAKRVIECHEEWGGWPTDEECEEYQRYGDQTYSFTV